MTVTSPANSTADQQPIQKILSAKICSFSTSFELSHLAQVAFTTLDLLFQFVGSRLLVEWDSEFQQEIRHTESETFRGKINFSFEVWTFFRIKDVVMSRLLALLLRIYTEGIKVPNAYLRITK